MRLVGIGIVILAGGALAGCTGLRAMRRASALAAPPHYVAARMAHPVDGVPAEMSAAPPPGENDGVEAEKVAPERPVLATRLLARFIRIRDLQSDLARAALALAGTEEFAPGLAERVDVERAVQALWVRNPGVVRSRHQWRAARERHTQATHFDQVVEIYSAWTRELRQPTGPMRWKGKRGVSRSEPVSGVLALAGRVADLDRRLSEQGVRETYQGVVTRLGRALAHLAHLDALVRIHEESLVLLQELEQVVKVRYTVARGSYDDLLQLQTARDRFQEMLATHADDREAIVARIRALLDLPPGTQLGPVAFPRAVEPGDLDLERAQRFAVAHRPDLFRARLELKRMQTVLALGRNPDHYQYVERLRRFDHRLRVESGTDRPGPEGGERPAGTPAPWAGWQEAFLQELERRIEARVQQQRGQELAARAAVLSARVKWLGARRNERLVREKLLDRAKQRVASLRSRYESGQATFGVLLQAQRDWLETRIDREGALLAIRQGWFQFERELGTRWEEKR